MRISDWSSDVCSSDLRQTHRLQGVDQTRAFAAVEINRRLHVILVVERDFRGKQRKAVVVERLAHAVEHVGQRGTRQRVADAQTGETIRLRERAEHDQIGSASCRERVCQYVWISVVGVSFKNKKNEYQ